MAATREDSARSRPYFIVNPASGGGRTRGRLDALERALPRFGIDGDVVTTRAPGDATELALGAIAAGRDRIVACGGDGTVYEVVNAVLAAGEQDRVAIGTVALGTGKDIARFLGLASAAHCLRAIAAGGEVRLDAGRIGLHDAEGNPIVRYFLLEASTGWIPEISQAVPGPLKRLGDTAPYVLTAFAKMAGPMSREFALSIDGEGFDGRYNSVSVHNMPHWGGDLLAAPGALADDGVLDAIRWGALPRHHVVRAVQRQQGGRGTHLEMEGIDRHPARTVRIASAKRTMVDLDGEFGGYLPAEISIIPGALRFLAPADAST